MLRDAAPIWGNPSRQPSGGAAGAVLVVLRLDRRAHALPVGVGELVELGEIGARAGREIARAVERDGLAGEPFAALGHEEAGEVLQLLHATDAAHGIQLRRVVEAAAVGAQALGRAFGGEGARRDRVEANAVA